MAPLALTFLLALLWLPSAAQGQDGVQVDHETWRVIGWNDACGVAFEHLYFSKLGAAISTRIGAAMIPEGREQYVARWALQSDGRLSWDEGAAAKTEKDLAQIGYARPGFLETIQDGSIGAQPGLAETLLSTATLSSRLKSGWPGSEWRWAGGNYSPSGACALLSFEKRDSLRHYRLLLLRVYNPRARRNRAYAHASNARLLFNAGDLAAAAFEAETAASLAPDLPVARYEHAAMLALTGSFDEAAVELSAAIKLEPKYGEKARGDIDFADLKNRDDFKEMTSRR